MTNMTLNYRLKNIYSTQRYILCNCSWFWSVKHFTCCIVYSWKAKQYLHNNSWCLQVLNLEKTCPSILVSAYSTWQNVLTARTDEIIGRYHGWEFLHSTRKLTFYGVAEPTKIYKLAKQSWESCSSRTLSSITQHLKFLVQCLEVVLHCQWQRESPALYSYPAKAEGCCKTWKHFVAKFVFPLLIFQNTWLRDLFLEEK
jgi:hypothetical protein